MAERRTKDAAETATGERGITAAFEKAVRELRRSPFFAGVPDEAMMALAARSRWQVYAPGEVVVDSGDPTDEVFFVAEGAVRVVVRTALGHEAVLNDLAAGQFFGELAAIGGTARSANVTALQRTRLCVIPEPAFMDVVLASPAAGLRLRAKDERLLGIVSRDERLLEIVAVPVRQRLMAELLRLSRDRGNGDGERVLNPPPQQHVLAQRIGTRRETVSREMAEMARAGLLTVGRRAIVLHRPDALRAEIEGRLFTEATTTGTPRMRHHPEVPLAGEVEDRASETESTGSQVSPTPEEIPEERSAAEAVDRMIAALDTATATVEAQLAELRRMRRAA